MKAKISSICIGFREKETGAETPTNPNNQKKVKASVSNRNWVAISFFLNIEL